MPRPRRTDFKGFAAHERVQLTPALLEGFVTLYLQERFDNPQPIPALHRKLWELYCSDYPLVGVAAPRGHAKSTAGTHAYGLASILFGANDHTLILSASEKMASDHLKDIAMELEENEALVKQFDVKLLVNNETELIGYVGDRPFRMVPKGSEQRVRGIKWRHKRPDLILVDDLEEDEAVMNQERRIKLREWMDNAVIPLGSDKCKIRVAGTILHFDSWLERIMSSQLWKTARFAAHKDFDDFSEILWPEKFPESRLRMIRQGYIENGNPSGYAQEYLNKPIASIDAYYRGTDFRPMDDIDKARNKNFYVGGDFAISKEDRANKTAFTIGGMDDTGMLHIVDVMKGKWDSLEIVDKMFEIHDKYHPQMWFLEKGQIEASIGPFLELEMLRRGKFLHIKLMTPVKDKPTRGRSFQARTRAGGVKYDTDAEWYPAYKIHMLQFPRSSEDDEADSTHWLGRGLTDMQEALTTEDLLQIQYDEELEDSEEQGRNPITGY